MDSAHSFFIRKLWQACFVLGFQAGDGVSKAHNEMHVGQHGCDGLDVPSLDHVAGAGFNRKLRHRDTQGGPHVRGERLPLGCSSHMRALVVAASCCPHTNLATRVCRHHEQVGVGVQVHTVKLHPSALTIFRHLRVVEEVHLRGHDREGVHTQPEPLITLLDVDLRCVHLCERSSVIDPPPWLAAPQSQVA